MKKAFLIPVLSLALWLSGCSSRTAAAPEAPAASPSAPAAVAGRPDGERFESTLWIEGMEETIRCEHIRSEALGFAMDYDYENFLRISEADRERFVSVWDDPAHPENYLEIRSDTRNAQQAADAISASLSESYDLSWDERELNNGIRCTRIEASVIKGANRMAEHIRAVYIIPAPDGCRVAAAHSFIMESEGFLRRFDAMVNTLSVLERTEAPLSDEQALSAVRAYCLAQNPDLEDIVREGEYPVYWEIESGDERQVVILFRSYTGALVRYYIDRSTGDTYVTEFVPGITPREAPTGEHFNLRDNPG